MIRPLLATAALLVTSVAFAQENMPAAVATGNSWVFKERFEIRANLRDSHEDRFRLKFPFPSDFLPVGQTAGFEETVDGGRHAELSVVQLQLDAAYGSIFAARAKLHAQDKYRRNPTSEDRRFDADELFIRFGPKPEFLDRPAGSSLFLQMGKAPKMERQPVRLLESYGLAATSFNRFEDTQFLLGGTVGRNFYWRLAAATGNPLYFRDSNALAGDNGIRELEQPHPDPALKSGFPILYNAEVEGYFLRTEHVQFGQGLGYRWQNSAENSGFDFIAFHYRRSMSDAEKLTGTFYLGDLHFLHGVGGFGLPVSGRTKEETGARLYTEFHNLTTTAQFTKQLVAGLHREGWEIESGYQWNLGIGPTIDGEGLLQYVQPAVRASGLHNRFRGPAQYVAPSVWWNWTKFDYGVRVGFARGVDLTLEHSKHNIGSPAPIDEDESLLTLRFHI
jgi:hypothetical protein